MKYNNETQVMPKFTTKQDRNIGELNEFELAAKHRKALSQEDYETCLLIKNEIDKRISEGTINHRLMNAFRFWNPKTNKFEGKPQYTDLNGLFDNYKNI